MIYTWRRNSQFVNASPGGKEMGKGSQHDFVGLAMLVAAGPALAAACLGASGGLGGGRPGSGGRGGKDSQHGCVGLAVLVAAGSALAAACLGAFGSLGAWAPGYEAWQLGSLMASVALAAALVLYHRRQAGRLRRGAAEREREVAKLEGEASDLRRTNEALRKNEARYRGAVAGLPVAVFAVDGEGVFRLAEGAGLDALGFEPDKGVGRSIFDADREAPPAGANARSALAGRTFEDILEVNGSAFEMRYSPLRENGGFSGGLGGALGG